MVRLFWLEDLAPELLPEAVHAAFFLGKGTRGEGDVRVVAGEHGPDGAGVFVFGWGCGFVEGGGVDVGVGGGVGVVAGEGEGEVGGAGLVWW